MIHSLCMWFEKTVLMLILCIGLARHGQKFSARNCAPQMSAQHTHATTLPGTVEPTSRYVSYNEIKGLREKQKRISHDCMHACMIDIQLTEYPIQ